MRKRKDKKRTGMWLFFLLLIGMLAGMGKGFSVRAATTEEKPKGQIVMSVEKATLGQGFIMEPQYVDFYEGDTMASITLRELKKIGRRYQYDGNMKSGFYLSEISDRNRGKVTIPGFITDMMTQSKLEFYETDNTPEYLGEMDYSVNSGWMYAHNGVLPNVSACEATPKNGDVLSWKFTLVTLGHDLNGDTTYFEKNNLEEVDRVKLYKLLAEINRNSELLKDSSVKAAYDHCVEMAMNLELHASKKDFSKDMATLQKALNWNTISDIQIYGKQKEECTVKNGTTEENISDFPKVLTALKDGSTTVNMNVTWSCTGTYDAEKEGDYTFKPEIPDNYVVEDDTELPEFTVHVKKFGDINSDDQVDAKDIEEIVSGKDSSNHAYLGQSDLEQDEEAAICDLNFDGKVDMQDYSLLVGAINQTQSKTEDSGRIALRFNQSEYAAGESGKAEIVLYSSELDTVGMQLSYRAGNVTNVTLEAKQDFTVEYTKENSDGCTAMLGRRTGTLSARNIRGTVIGTVSFTCVKSGNPDISFGASEEADGIFAGKNAVSGYRNGYQVSFDTSSNYGTDIRFVAQLNDGNVRVGTAEDQMVVEEGKTLNLIQLSFRYYDAEDTTENRIRIRAQIPEGSTLEIGGGLKNGNITDPLTLDDGIYYAKGSAGCFTGGQSSQRETCVLYGVLKEASGSETWYKFQVERKGYKAAEWNYTQKTPLLLDGWSKNNPEVLTGTWDLKKAGLQSFDEDGNQVDDLEVVMPSSDSSNSFYYKASTATTGTFYAKEAGNYWLEVRDKKGEVRGKIRICAVYPYEAAQWYLNKAKEIPLEYSKYSASVSDQLFNYKDMVENLEEIQDKYSSNVPVYLDLMGRYVLTATSERATDTYGYEFLSDYLRTEAVSEIRQAIREIRPVLEKNRYTSQTKKSVTFSGSSTISRPFAKKSFLLNLRVNTDGKITYQSSNKKVAVVSASGKITMKGMGKTVITVKTAETSRFKAGTKKITLSLNPGNTRLVSLKSLKKQTFTVKWKKYKGISGYQIQYAASKNFQKAKTVKAKAKTTSGMVKKLKSRKTYYVRIRTMKKINGQTVFSSWSKAKKIKIK